MDSPEEARLFHSHFHNFTTNDLMLSLIEEASGFCLFIFDIFWKKLLGFEAIFLEKNIHFFTIMIFLLNLPKWQTDNDIPGKSKFFQSSQKTIIEFFEFESFEFYALWSDSFCHHDFSEISFCNDGHV
jgi:hypothetical protein